MRQFTKRQTSILDDYLRQIDISGRLTSSAPAPPAFAWSAKSGHRNVRLSGQQTGNPASVFGVCGYSIKGDICPF